MAKNLTSRQREVLKFILEHVEQEGVPPTSREIQSHFGFSSQTAAMDHLRALERKGFLRRTPGKARSLLLTRDGRENLGSQAAAAAERTQLIPIYGQIAAGMPVESSFEEGEAVAVDAKTMGLSADEHIFGLRVRGDSMIGAHILDGDVVVLSARPARNGDIVAALIDGETTLKRYIERDGHPFLKAENPLYPELRPATELTVQGVMVGLVRGDNLSHSFPSE